MLPYFLIFLLAACFALAAPPDAPMRGAGYGAFMLFAILLALMIGFRWEVGGDWSWDTRRMIHLGDADFIDYTKVTDPGYASLMWLGAQTGFNIWFVHLLGGGIFAYGLWRFCLDQVYPWLCMVVAIPYLVIVVAMGYDRQAVAIGFIMLAMVAIRNRSLLGFACSMSLATTMHLTALTFVPVFLLGSRLNKIWTLIVAGPFFMVGYYFSLQDSLQHKVQSSISGYIETGYSSSGAAVRIAMNALPAFLYFVFRSRLKLDDDERRFLDVLAIIALAFVGLLYLSPSSTAVDRMALYIIPIQLLVLGRLPLVFARKMEPDRQVSCVRLSDKTSRLRPRHVGPKPTQAYEPEVPIEVREWIAPAPSSPDVVLEAQPPAQPRRRVGVKRPIRLAESAYRKVVRPSAQHVVHYKMVAAGIVVYSATVMFVWLNFAVDADAWVPYSLIDVDRLVGLSY